VKRLRLHVRGTVQGVGFRPFVYRLAVANDLRGWVRNDCEGVTVDVQGEPERLSAFRRGLGAEGPPLARVESVDAEELPPADLPRFFIDRSAANGPRSTGVTPDAAVCDDCLAEMHDPADRRHRYPFLNCTHCGPRFTIARDVPYDRARTGMAGFALCPACRREYEDPADRRFHAQPTACPECGPRLWAVDAAGNPLEGDPIETAARVLRGGGTVALKGLGGFHLAADATHDAAVRALRERKRREAKPFAVMARDLETARTVAAISEAEASLLRSAEAPVVLLARRPGSLLAPAVAPGLDEIGIMLPYTPLHHLLCDEDGTALLVMTSGNRRDEPIAVENEEAMERLSGIAELFLLHDRPIVARADDSVVRRMGGAEVLIRRSRGYVPRGLKLPWPAPTVFAAGASQKNTVCVTRGDEAFLSQHVGDLDEPAVRDFHRDAAAHLERILGVRPEVAAHDLHLDYPSTAMARERTGVRFEGVQHHHAHVASCLAENGFEAPVVGLALDGFGLGDDGGAWGGEILVADLAGFRRAGHLRAVPLAGGDRAAREPWRMALVHLHEAFGKSLWSLPLPLLERIGRERGELLLKAARTGLGSPPTTSAGRLFDAVAALCDLGDRVSYEGEAATRLEVAARLAGPGRIAPYPLPVIERDEVLVLDTAPLVHAAAVDLMGGAGRAEVAARFHAGLAEGFAEASERVARRTGIHTAALSGGCFQNRVLAAKLRGRLEARGLTVLTHRRVPANDGGLALGQAAVAGARALGRPSAVVEAATAGGKAP
jgi:hydrogenase maturation protein HypF